MAINFADMTLGQEVELQGSNWTAGPEQDYEDAQAYSRAHLGTQFEVTSGWRANDRGLQVRVFTLKRTR